ncbi:T9SS type A sorting domain-containing protein [uncultured Algibacter sp.]|uniref:T9SS type A sorting domain-containing protein n=1 Tax=uncultured Algibacter sp. TaxID=298659 RepID=UPI002603FB2A|nr:T9SS type A sorting domain-containing protein [uncultured Algibacter sp.]
MDNNWVLESIKIDNIFYPSSDGYPELDDDGNRIPLIFHPSETLSFDSTVCGLIEGQFSMDDEEFNTFTILSTNTTLESCTNLGDQDFESLYFGFFQPSTTYRYDIGCLLSGSACYLTIYSPNGDEVRYWNGLLSIPRRDKSLFSKYPNPVKDILHIKTTHNLSDYKIKIIDFTGKVIWVQENNNTNSINVEKLSQGVYFISIEDELGNVSSEKFIKS